MNHPPHFLKLAGHWCKMAANGSRVINASPNMPPLGLLCLFLLHQWLYLWGIVVNAMPSLLSCFTYQCINRWQKNHSGIACVSIHQRWFESSCSNEWCWLSAFTQLTADFPVWHSPNCNLMVDELCWVSISSEDRSSIWLDRILFRASHADPSTQVDHRVPEMWLMHLSFLPRNLPDWFPFGWVVSCSADNCPTFCWLRSNGEYQWSVCRSWGKVSVWPYQISLLYATFFAQCSLFTSIALTCSDENTPIWLVLENIYKATWCNAH